MTSKDNDSSGEGGGFTDKKRHSFENNLNCLLDGYISDDNEKYKRNEDKYSTNNNNTLLKFVDKRHAHKSFHFFNQLKKSNILCDLTILAQNIEIKCHKIVLASCSPYFYAMFSTNLQESKLNKIVMKDVNCYALDILIDFMYTGEIEITEDNVQSLLDVSNLLQILIVKESCCEFLAAQLDITNCIGIKRLADLLSCISLTKQANVYIEQYFCEIIKNEEFYNLTADQLIELIKDDNLVVPSEEIVYEAAVSWLKQDFKNRIQYMERIMEHVRFPLIEKSYLMRITNDPVISKNPKCQKRIMKLILSKKSIENADFLDTKPRVRLGLPQFLLIIGGQGPKPISSVDAYDFRSHNWISRTDLPVKRCRAGVVCLNGLVYVIGGFNGINRLRTVDILNLLTDKWEKGPDLVCVRSTHNVALLNNKVYAIGGFDGVSGIMSAEVFDPVKNEWNLISNMSCKRSSVGVTAYDDHVYAIGGFCGDLHECLDTVERYDPKTDRWYPVSKMFTKRSGPAVCTYDGKIYVFGGHDGPVTHKSAECYDFKTKKWQQIAEMNIPRRNSGAIVYNDHIYCIGGDDGKSNLTSAEIYNPTHNMWSLMPTFLQVARSYAGILAIEKPLK